jgi:hypothetical protein
VRRGVGPIASQAPGLTWVRDLGVGDMMIDGSIREGRLRPLGLCWTAASKRWSPALGERAGSVAAIFSSAGSAVAIGAVGIAQSATGSRAAAPSWRRLWKARRASLRAIVSEACVCESPRALSSR